MAEKKSKLETYQKRMESQAAKSESIIKSAAAKGGLDELKQLSKVVNQRLVRLERETGTVDSWAAKKLKKRMEKEGIESWTKGNRVALSAKKIENMTPAQRQAYKKAMQAFITSETSTKIGIEKAKLTTIEAIGSEYNVTSEVAEAMFQAVENDNIANIFNYMSPSDFWAVYDEVIVKKGGTKDDLQTALKANFGAEVNDADISDIINKTKAGM